ncbi:hypothetical protein PF005_g26736 [Phytophthora fragariae]|uniref:Uncharacterized protein n=1 Tax=Phytophthora fragariae TaxID=53985 RepID=A0A6A3VPQ3_9STRA|nr:hypothetical protein PF003_g38011 [Phytophthora fragariae]KAE9169710.1 hypothetical protein PF002_g30285 [Phytophthora fragariae]KAE9172382.1 hypothetical protein PF005_g26736 [Phytophthora fragariae]KAE9288769.1 hypothetical protein PF008_g26051 [Phytophthora fragariae]
MRRPSFCLSVFLSVRLRSRTQILVRRAISFLRSSHCCCVTVASNSESCSFLRKSARS